MLKLPQWTPARVSQVDRRAKIKRLMSLFRNCDVGCYGRDNSVPVGRRPAVSDTSDVVAAHLTVVADEPRHPRARAAFGQVSSGTSETRRSAIARRSATRRPLAAERRELLPSLERSERCDHCDALLAHLGSEAVELGCEVSSDLVGEDGPQPVERLGELADVDRLPPGQAGPSAPCARTTHRGSRRTARRGRAANRRQCPGSRSGRRSARSSDRSLRAEARRGSRSTGRATLGRRRLARSPGRPTAECALRGRDRSSRRSPPGAHVGRRSRRPSTVWSGSVLACVTGHILTVQLSQCKTVCHGRHRPAQRGIRGAHWSHPRRFRSLVRRTAASRRRRAERGRRAARRHRLRPVRLLPAPTSPRRTSTPWRPAACSSPTSTSPRSARPPGRRS